MTSPIDARAAASSLLSAQVAAAQAQGFQAAVAAAAAPTVGAWVPGGVWAPLPPGGGYVLPESYQFGGIVRGPIGQPQLAVVHGGERYLGPEGTAGKAGVTVIFYGDVYGFSDFQRKVAEAVKASYRGGGLRFLG